MSKARKKHVNSSDPRKLSIKAALLRKAGRGTKVTLVTEDCVENTFTGHVMAKQPGHRNWDSLGNITVTSAEVATNSAVPLS